MLKKLIVLPALALSLFTVQPVFANHYDHKNNCQCQKSMSSMVQQLDLTSEQTAKIKAIKESSRETVKADIQKLRELRKQMHELVTADQLDEAKLNDLVNQKTSILSSLMKTRIMTKNQIFQVLNEKQKEKLKETMKQHHS